MKTYEINPVPKPRMTRSDKWKQRKCVLEYRAYKDEVRLKRVDLPEAGGHVTFVLPMPKSWTEKKKSQMCGEPHQQKPDVDNLTKALLDALHKDDSHVWDIRATKVWGLTGKILIQQAA